MLLLASLCSLATDFLSFRETTDISMKPLKGLTPYLSPISGSFKGPAAIGDCEMPGTKLLPLLTLGDANRAVLSILWSKNSLVAAVLPTPN